MIGVDTNILVRLFVADDKNQAAKARAFLSRRTVEDPAYVSVVTLIELMWVLKRGYGYKRDGQLTVLQAFLESANVVLEHEGAVRVIVEQHADTSVDLADILIAETSRMAGCTSLVTFDKPASKLVNGMDLLT
ncbi:PIN domain-containing protein [Pelagibacterium xiamenense]|uniref:PIN domain-containing protein n=1 Tax=Pelagibacterium xiamenense TaxID=2901140 RepID=UPI001E4A2663|nr:type II toxin-antitoxin system VapC family toxin [Pelagibacterium xiamenense]MCD7060458.1 type II toxin-antitoxin system VapC family toxin [Pelagibacterium xiamenense]